METTRERMHPFKTVRYLLFGILLCAAVGIACFIGGRLSAGDSDAAELSAVVLEQRLTDVRELATVTYAYTNMARFENSSEFYGVTLPLTTKSFILTYDGEIKAGVDLSKAQVKTGPDSVTVTLPEAEILSHEIDQDSVEVFDEKTSIFNPFTVEDYSAFQRDQAAAMEKKATDRGLLTEAREKAVNAVQELLGQVIPDTYTLNVE